MKTVEQKVAEAIKERGIWVKIGWIPFYIRPITYGQIVDLSAEVSTMQEAAIPEHEYDVFNHMLKIGGNGEQIARIAVIALFRSSFMRLLMRRYVRKHLTVAEYKRISEFVTLSMDPAFFLSTTIFLKGLDQTAPTITTAPSPFLAE